MKFKRSDVFEMVDALFHKYASFYRNDAKKELLCIIQRMEEAHQQNNAADANPRERFCRYCGRAYTDACNCE